MLGVRRTATAFHVRGSHVLAIVDPIGIDADGSPAPRARADRGAEDGRLQDSLRVGRSAIGVDRLDYSKGLVNRFEAFGHLLGHYPEARRHVSFLQIAARSREDVDDYRRLRDELNRLVGDINGRYSEFDWAPIRYMTRPVRRRTLAGFYRVARLGVVTPLRDGMNLVAKEYVAAQDPADPGVLILSRFAGAAEELTEALIVNPFDADESRRSDAPGAADAARGARRSGTGRCAKASGTRLRPGTVGCSCHISARLLAAKGPSAPAAGRFGYRARLTAESSDRLNSPAVEPRTAASHPSKRARHAIPLPAPTAQKQPAYACSCFRCIVSPRRKRIGCPPNARPARAG